jgi:nascent polypeptide-associated complex subunit alpha
MMPNMDPRAMKGMLAKMGIKTEELNAIRVTIETVDKTITIANPQITKISAQGSISFQVSGEVTEEAKDVLMEITDDDINLVMENTGITDHEKAKKALLDANGDIATAILALQKESSE